MTTEQQTILIQNLERCALNSEPMPEKLTQPEQLLYMSLRCLYREYRGGIITKQQAQKEKQRLLDEFKMNAMWYREFKETAQMRNRLSHYLCDINKGGCDKCKLAVKIFTHSDGYIYGEAKNKA